MEEYQSCYCGILFLRTFARQQKSAKFVNIGDDIKVYGYTQFFFFAIVSRSV